MKANEVYEKVTTQLVRAIEAGASGDQWRMPWHSISGGTFSPMNVSTKVHYRGGNVLALWLEAESRGYLTGEWATYKQWAALGAQVRKGERAAHGVKWSRIIDRKTEEERMVPCGFAVFHAEQVDGYERDTVVAPTVAPIDMAESFFGRIGAQVEWSNQAAYVPSRDVITMPTIDQFRDAQSYYSVFAHEHGHWTSASKRCDRDLGAKGFASEGYASEELVAELCSAFTMNRIGLCAEPREDHAQYLASWLSALKADPKHLFRVASLAQKACDYLLDRAKGAVAESAMAAA